MIDWEKLRKPALKRNQPTMREKFEKAHGERVAAEQQQALVKAQEPLLKSVLLDYLVNRKPIEVLHPFQNATESLGGITRDEEDDGFYQVQKSETSAFTKFEETMETIPRGEKLVFKSMDKTLQQWIFKGLESKKEYAIYYNPVILFREQQIKNPGFYGLLYATDLTNQITGE